MVGVASIVLGLIVGADVTVHVQTARGLEGPETASIANALADAIGNRAGLRVVVDDPSAWFCADPATRCAPEIASRNESREVVLVSLVRGLTKLRLAAVRVSSAGQRIGSTDVDLPLEGWGHEVRDAAAALFDAAVAPPVAKNETPPDAVRPAPIELDVDRGIPTWPWWSMVGAGVVGATVSAGFAVSSQNALDELGAQSYGPEGLEIQSRARQHGQIATVLGISAASLVGAGLTFLFLDASDVF